MRKGFCLGSVALSLCHPTLGYAETRTDIAALFARAEQDGRVGLARKTKPVDVRPAKQGEIIITVIAGEGKETQSPPAKVGDMVVRNRCPETGNEETLVTASRFTSRYEGPTGPADATGWRPYQPRGVEMLYFTVRDADGSFTFEAPWGEPMVARPKDVIARDPQDVKNTYRIAAAAFACTYEIIRPAS